MIGVPPAAVAQLPTCPGVYGFRDEGGSVLYIGRAADLRRRLRSYRTEQGDRPWLARMVSRVTRVEVAVCDSTHEAAWLERNLLERRRPRWNKAAGGKELPVAIRVENRRRGAGISVVHLPTPPDGARYFGPYLGGTRVRMAVAALQRQLPLAYAVEGLDGAGRNLARVLGVAEGDGEALLTTVVAVLERDPLAVAAVRAALVQRRADAARRLAFERAAECQAHLGAIVWIVAEQKAAMLTPQDLDIHGWADDVLVSFEIRACRLRRWRQRRCLEASARPHVAATPGASRGFANRNAAVTARVNQAVIFPPAIAAVKSGMPPTTGRRSAR